MGLEQRRGSARFSLIAAGHHFLINALPVRDPDSSDALAMFVEKVVACRLPLHDVEAVLVRCLTVLDYNVVGRFLSLACLYRSGSRNVERCAELFLACVEDMIASRRTRSRPVQESIAIIEKHYGQSDLTQKAVATAVRVRPAALSIAFSAELGMTFGEYLRNTRLHRAAEMLADAKHRRIKDVWVQVGYNHASNFDHDFRRRFGVTPREYRSPGVRSVPLEKYSGGHTPDMQAPPKKAFCTRGTILIVDDDEGTCVTIGRHLRLQGYTSFVVRCGDEGLREARRVKPQAILLEYRLPDMDGVTFLRALRRDSISPPPAIALFTADWDVYNEAPEIHALDAIIVSKLCCLDDVQRLVDELLGRSGIPMPA